MILIGFMGAGKTSVMHDYQKQYHFLSYDLDAIFEEKYGAIDTFFKQKGQERFRKLETQLLNEMLLSLSPPFLLATGGGIVETKENRVLLSKRKDVVYLYASFETIWKRLLSDKHHKRPLLQQKENVYQLYEKRKNAYEKCSQFQINTDTKTSKEIAQDVFTIQNKK